MTEKGEKSRRRWATFAAVLVVGMMLRVLCTWRCCVGYDEVFVMGVGLDKSAASWGRFLLEVPLRRSDGITPLWWWLQAVPVLAVGELTLAGLRVVPLALGAICLIITALMAPRRIGRGPALVLLFVVATSDVLAFTNARGEFAESLLIAAVIPAMLLVGNWRRPWLKGLLWLVLLMAHLGKGALLVGGLLTAEAVMLLLMEQEQRRRCGRALGLSAGMGVLPTLLWLVFVNGQVFASGPVETDAGVRDSLWEALWGITFGYAQTKPHVVASTWDALQLYVDASVWPLTALVAVPVLAGFVAAAVQAGRGDWRGRRGRLVVAVLPWTVVAVGVVIGRGMVGARFHLLYLPAVWLAASVGLWRLRHLPAPWLVGLGFLWAAHLAMAFSWYGWLDHALHPSWGTAAAPVLAAVVVALAVLLPAAGRLQRGAVVAAMCVLLTGAWFAHGVWRWGPAGRFEPMAERRVRPEPTLLERVDAWRRGEANYPDRYDKSLLISLANYYLQKEGASGWDAARAVHFAEREVAGDEQDPRAWFYLGRAYQRQGRPVEQVRAAYERSYAIRPERIVAEALRNLKE
ncbi:MAG: hypothetical protein JSU68_12425 [Phycisphaerales bacterium]|nr:MAG: hypothetical protein JSU68_12425 [Phycisphaerales bacterium]